ncbi:MAG: hypothetical protein QOF93_850 [Verrucomicrobiota bacterium]
MLGAALLLGFVAITLFAQEPDKDPDSFDIEPPLLIPNREDEQLSNAKAASAPARDVDLGKLEKELVRAKRNAASAERLCKIGALSKLEAEQRVLRSVHLEFDLANARLICAKEEMLKKEKQLTAGDIAKTETAQTETRLALAIEAAHAATIKREQAEIDAAEANVHRQEKLLAFGSARKSDVERAAQKLAELKSHKD